MRLAKDASGEYLKQSVMSAGPAELIVMLFDGCIKNIKLARLGLERSDFERARQSLGKAQLIVDELINCLDMSFELSKQLLRVYEYISHELFAMSASRDLSAAPGLIELLESSRDTWRSVAQAQRAGLAGSGR